MAPVFNGVLQDTFVRCRLWLPGETEGSFVGTRLPKGYPGRPCVNGAGERLGLGSDARFIWFVGPQHIVLDQRIEDRQQLSHRGGQCDFLRFALGHEALVKCFDLWIESCGSQGRRVPLLACPAVWLTVDTRITALLGKPAVAPGVAFWA